MVIEPKEATTMGEEKKGKKIWYKNWKFWLGASGWAAFVVTIVLALSTALLNVGGSQKDLSNLRDSYKELKDSYKEICSKLEKLPQIETKINQEIIPSINYLREMLNIKSPPMKEMRSLMNELKAKDAQLELVSYELKVKTAQLESLISYRKKYLESASDIKTVLKKVAKDTSGLRSSLFLFTDNLIDIQDTVIKSPDTVRKISQDSTLAKIYDELKGSYAVISKTGSELEKTSETIEGVSYILESITEVEDIDSHTIIIPPKIDSPKKEGPAPIPKN